MIGIAFVGFRHTHILSLYEEAKNNPNVTVLGAFESDDTTRQEMMEKHNISFPYESYEQLLADARVDVVAVGDYYGIRGARTIRALECGKHVITDKPLCTSLEECARIRQLAEETGKTVYMMLTLRFHNAYQTAKRLLAKGVIGEVRSVGFDGQHPLSYGSRPAWYFEEGKHGGTINDIAIHGIDALRFLTGERVEEILFTNTRNVYASEEPAFLDSALFACRMTGGGTVMADVSYSAPNGIAFQIPTYWSFRIWGSEGMLHFGCNLPVLHLYKAGASEGIEITPDADGVGLLEDFLACLEGRADTVLTTGEVLDATEDTLRIQAIADHSHIK